MKKKNNNPKVQPSCKVQNLTKTEQKIVQYIILRKAQQIYQNLERFRNMGLEKTTEILEHWLDNGEAKIIYNEDTDIVELKIWDEETQEYST